MIACQVAQVVQGSIIAKNETLIIFAWEQGLNVDYRAKKEK